MSNRITQEDAIATLQAMFSQMDAEVLLMVLESNGGHMERTVECLLSMDSSAAAPGVDSAPAPVVAPNHPAPQVRDAVPLPPIVSSYLPADFNAPAPAPVVQPPVVVRNDAINIFDSLPEDFLRPPSFFVPISQAARSRAAGLASSQEEQDRILATLLQDQLFMEGLRQNPSLLDARAHEIERLEVAEIQAREQRQMFQRQQQMNARESAIPAGHVSRTSAAPEVPLPARYDARAEAPQAAQSDRQSSVPRPSAGDYDVVGDDEDGDAPAPRRELTFSEKLSLLSFQAKQKLKDFFSSDKDQPQSSSAHSSTYHNLPSIEDEANGGSLQEMSAVPGGDTRDRRVSASGNYGLDQDDAYLFDDVAHEDSEPLQRRK